MSKSLVNYLGAVLAVVLALILTLLIWALIKPIASPLFLIAIIICTWKFGFREGIFATILSGITIDYFFIQPQYKLGGDSTELTRLIFFALETIALCWLVASHKTAAKEIKDSREQLQALSLHEQTLREDERRRIALEIHDELGQALTGLKMEIHLLNQRINSLDSSAQLGQISDKFTDLLSLVNDTILSVRRIATELRPPILDDLG
ncbi:MAG: DUF4118 domain-containing protein, partial [Microcoleus sp. Co-bin12]|nr:DUF4118 domain-containing protein [Microcoleus sp. Co-bin12]